MMTLAHGAGAGMNHVFMTTLSSALAELGISTLRFNFPFTENKKGRPDTPAVAHQTIEAAINLAHERFPAVPLFVSGKSFGGRMSSQHLVNRHQTNINGIIFYGFPLHPPKKPSIDRADHLKDLRVPMLFLQGTRDELAKWDLVENVCSSLRLATLKKIEGADHAFKAGKRDVVSELAIATQEWTEKMIQNG
ncbi:MAG TPA: alpha/beta family hydrolase [Chitinophagaceae bacterium]|nr:alpha/beta family hydrolase [Chitinophagaceae bacterium]